MYKRFIRPILFLLSPETVHHLLIWKLRFLFAIPGVQWLVSFAFSKNNPRLEREFCGIRFKNPVGLAAGFDKNADIYNEFSAFGFSFIEVGTVTPQAQLGNPKPRLFRLVKDKALINRMGFNNKGAENAARNLNKHHKIVIGGNIGKNTSTPNDLANDDYEFCFRSLYEHVDYFVVNVSCPNIKDLNKLQDKDKLIELLGRLLKIRDAQDTHKPVLLKIAPDLNTAQLDEVIEIINETGTDGLVITNTTRSRENLSISPDQVKSIGDGGLSGKPLTSRSTEVIRYIAEKSNKSIPIMGVGGIMSTADALEKLEAGATLIQIYTGFIYEGPCFVNRINKAILKKQIN